MTEFQNNTMMNHDNNSSKVDTLLRVAAASYGDGCEIWQSSQMDASSLEALQNLLEGASTNNNNEGLNEPPLQQQQQRLFQLIERQTAMIIDLHRRLDNLYAVQQPAAAPSQETSLRLQKKRNSLGSVSSQRNRGTTTTTTTTTSITNTGTTNRCGTTTGYYYYCGCYDSCRSAGCTSTACTSDIPDQIRSCHGFIHGITASTSPR
jgi:hypothetical protein